MDFTHGIRTHSYAGYTQASTVHLIHIYANGIVNDTLSTSRTRSETLGPQPSLVS